MKTWNSAPHCRALWCTTGHSGEPWGTKLHHKAPYQTTHCATIKAETCKKAVSRPSGLLNCQLSRSRSGLSWEKYPCPNTFMKVCSVELQSARPTPFLAVHHSASPLRCCLFPMHYRLTFIKVYQHFRFCHLMCTMYCALWLSMRAD